MTHFFRKIRYKLMENNKLGKYLKYAIGEIVLVMVGILLALQVSNWNQQRIAGHKEELLLSALHEEFVQNKAQLEEVVSFHRKSLNATENLMALFPIDPATINLDTLRSTMKFWAFRYTFNPSQGVVRSLVNTSSFELISDLELRALLVSWEDVLADYQEEEILAAKNVNEKFGPIILAHASWKNGWGDDRADRSFLASFQFENIFYQRQNNLIDILGDENKTTELTKIENTIDRIIELSKTSKP